ncbi:hypothetical protein [Mycobacterium asiaticum]|uniref:Uncharacterized protein n=1 Tax=Mycobacterium asiaticum TaxID=1790 RepID=A0A1A3MZY1_MYCAS|nr:hypothetical protein [Mycobacterium asiaticum]OBK15453.1 hypothetical protein A5636_05690 [Mycobacterium asiaticum]
MTEEFLTDVQTIIGPVLAGFGFELAAFQDDIDEDGVAGSVAFYRSPDCQLQIYNSKRAGEINCMIALVGAAQVYGLFDRTGEWQYLARFADRAELAELIRSEGTGFPTEREELERIKTRIERFYPIAHAGILKMSGNLGQ